MPLAQATQLTRPCELMVSVSFMAIWPTRFTPIWAPVPTAASGWPRSQPTRSWADFEMPRFGPNHRLPWVRRWLVCR